MRTVTLWSRSPTAGTRTGHVAVATLVALASACAAVLGVEDLPRHHDDGLPSVDAGADAPADHASPTPIVYAEGPCGLCVAEHCFDAETSCRGDVACSATYACIAKCAIDDAACRAACERKHPAGAATGGKLDQLDACRRATCLDACYGEKGLISTILDGACSACVDTKCQPEERACIQAGGCERVFSCVGDEPPLNPDRALECQYRRPLGPELDALVACYQGCAGVCPFGRAFECAGKFSWQTGHGVVDHVVTFNKFPGHADPAPGLTVSACDPNDCETCSFPIVTGTTDANGVVHLPLAPGVQGFRGCLYVSGPGFLTNLYYYGRPVTRAEGQFHVSIAPANILSLLELAYGIKTLPGRGHVGVDVWDCLFEHARGVTFELSTADASTAAYYARDGLVAFDAVETDVSGAGGFVNVPAGDFEVVARDGKGDVVGRTKGHVVAGGLTGVSVFPSAAP